MILYKYYGFNAGIAALESSRLGFRKPAYFNDPFELTCLDNTVGEDSLTRDWEDKIKALRESVHVLSLTRAPVNPLMWSHYGENHEGFVIGYEVDTPFLNELDNCLIPVEQGDVLYTNTKPIHKVTQEQINHVHELWLEIQKGEKAEALVNQYNIKNLTTKLFLTKHASWVYEEEVRIIKSAHSLLESMKNEYASPMRKEYNPFKQKERNVSEVISSDECRVGVPGLKIFDFKVNISEVYLGVRNPYLNTYKKENGLEQNDVIINKANNENWSINKITISKGTWGLKSNETTPDIFKTNA